MKIINRAPQSVFVLSYRWRDLEARTTSETYASLDEAEERRDIMLKEEKERAIAFDPKAVGNFEVTIDRYNFDMQCSQEVV